jgi:uncharacterized protein YkwD
MLFACVSCVGAGAQTAQAAGDDMHVIGDKPDVPGTVAAQPVNVQTIFQMTNQDRAAQGLPALTWSPALAAAAEAHGQRMAAAANSELSHRYPGEADLATRAAQAGAHFASVAENIAQGGGAEQIERSWMNSVPHRSNILDPRMNAIGIAVVASGGTLYAVEDFADARASLSTGDVEQKVGAELSGLGIAVAHGQTGASLADEARRNCPQAEGLMDNPGAASRARFVLRWEGSELTLPAPLVDAVKSGKFTTAAVGACAPTGQHAFSAVRVAVLLY